MESDRALCVTLLLESVDRMSGIMEGGGSHSLGLCKSPLVLGLESVDRMSGIMEVIINVVRSYTDWMCQPHTGVSR